VDGFRVDAAWGVKERNPAFWPKLGKALNALKPDVFLLAEASARDPYYVTHGFDAAYDWGKELGHWSWEKVFDDPAWAGDKLRKALSGRETPPDQIVRFLNNNDTGARFITRHGEDTQRVAAVLMHTLPGIPVVYNGDEVGAEFEPYEDPAPLTWADPHQLRPLYKKLAELRQSLPALRKGAWEELRVERLPGVYAFTRDAGNQQLALVVLNFGKAAKVTLDVPARLRAGHVLDALTGREVATNPGHAAISLQMPKSSAMVLVPTGRED
jgi:glycosidase